MATGAAVRMLKARTASRSATQSVSPMSAEPRGSFSVTPLRPPAMNISESMEPSPLSRLMNPCAEPLTFETKYRSSTES